LFSGYLKLARQCQACGLDLGAMDSGDGPAVFIVPVITMPPVFGVWGAFEPPMRVHAILWPMIVLGLSLWLLPRAKEVMIGLQFRHDAGEHRA
jgi:uncharacterized protein (DUF983 family)